MKVTITTNLKIDPIEAMKLSIELMEERRRNEFNYGLLTKGVFEKSPVNGIYIEVKQKSGTHRKTNYSPLEIVIEKHNPLF